ncbi:type II secretion system F family protein [Tabrizicola oligotrophica]|uniref:Type II secretion system F family protein n=1 Tax=Tabrizicola oligotrophica TaxID=2710650 RepID=A0A6M0QV07_9RHOB|nr:type II secretion system F family protein [Tabrizicola oligotrophica]NEY91249.1 type II secretion system F family protein [Tabrizicola oligotrophica]
MTDILILSAIFLAVVLFVFALLNYLAGQRQIRRNIEQVTNVRGGKVYDPDALFAEDNDSIAYFMDVQRRNQPDSLEMRLIRAGFFTRDALRSFNLVRFLVAALVFVGVWYIGQSLRDTGNPAVPLVFAAVLSGASIIVSNIVLERIGKRNVRMFRRYFPDFLDLIIVCVDAGMSIEASLDRVAREFLRSQPSFGLHLAVVSLEVRAGRSLHEALSNLAMRINLEEVRTLAVLFRQSQELGSSVIKTLRVYSSEMRQIRLLQAEEKANALPVKMLLPLAAFLFPVNLVMVLVPVLIRIVRMISTMSPG